MATPVSLNVEQAVTQRYSGASQQQEVALCCPVEYDTTMLEILPDEIIERDYGCGDPSRYVQEGETVLDLGSGGGKICYIASHLVGESGRVIGVDMNADMLDLARKYQGEISKAIGWNNVEFYRGRIQDLGLNLEMFELHLAENPIDSADSYLDASQIADSMRTENPMIGDDSVDVVISNCVLNLVKESDRYQLFSEVARVLKPGGRAVISDIISDQEVPAHLKSDPELWSGCISGAFELEEMINAFLQVGLEAVEILVWQEDPWVVVEDIPFRSVTIRAYKPCTPSAAGDENDSQHSAIYHGPWAAVMDESGATLHRGQETQIDQKTYQRMSHSAYSGKVIRIKDDQGLRKVESVNLDLPISDCCTPDGDCC